MWQDKNGTILYVGHSINLYNRVTFYFMASILSTKARKVLRYFNKHGFIGVDLIIYLVHDDCVVDDVIKLEQHFIDFFKPSLNVDPIARGSGYHSPMSEKMREKLRQQRGKAIYVYDNTFQLIYVFASKQQMYDCICIHHTTLDKCLSNGVLYLNLLWFSLDLIEESIETDLLTLQGFQKLVEETRQSYVAIHPSSKSIIALFKDDPKQNKEFDSLNSLARFLKGDRQVIRSYLQGKKTGFYRDK